MRKPANSVVPAAPAKKPAADIATAGATLGATIRRARQHHHRTLQQVAQAADISVSSLSQIERNLLTPSVATLKRIADALHIPAGKLMFSTDARSTRATVAVLRKGQRKSVAFPNSEIRYELLTPDLRRR